MTNFNKMNNSDNDQGEGSQWDALQDSFIESAKDRDVNTGDVSSADYDVYSEEDALKIKAQRVESAKAAVDKALGRETDPLIDADEIVKHDYYNAATREWAGARDKLHEAREKSVGLGLSSIAEDLMSRGKFRNREDAVRAAMRVVELSSRNQDLMQGYQNLVKSERVNGQLNDREKQLEKDMVSAYMSNSRELNDLYPTRTVEYDDKGRARADINQTDDMKKRQSVLYSTARSYRELKADANLKDGNYLTPGVAAVEQWRAEQSQDK